MGRPTKYSAQDADAIADYSRQHGRLAAQKHYGMTDGQLGGVLYRYYHKKHKPLFDFHITADKPIVVRGDALIIGDVHAPCTDWELAWRVGEIAERYLDAPRTLIVAGDIFNLDWMSTYPALVPLHRWKHEKAAAKALFELWLTLFDRIVVFAGNHDRRAAKHTEGMIGMGDLMALVTSDARVQVSEHGHCILKSGKREFRVSHGANYSINTGVVGSELANKFSTNMVLCHQHHASISLDRFKRHIVVDNPALVDQKKLAYVTLDDKKNPNMARGFTLIRDGEPQIFVEGITVWSHWLSDKRAERKAA